MARSPFSSPPAPAAPTPTAPPPPPPAASTTVPGARPMTGPGAPHGPAGGPGAGPGRGGQPREGERRTLVVGRGISVQGTVQDAERLVVEGTVEASMIHAAELSISPGGVFKGEVEVDQAEVAGTIDGTLTARHTLVIRATGRVLGTARCRRLTVEDGGQISGRMEMLAEGTTTAAS